MSSNNDDIDLLISLGILVLVGGFFLVKKSHKKFNKGEKLTKEEVEHLIKKDAFIEQDNAIVDETTSLCEMEPCGKKAVNKCIFCGRKLCEDDSYCANANGEAYCIYCRD